MGCGQTKSLVQDFSMGGGKRKKEDESEGGYRYGTLTCHFD